MSYLPPEVKSPDDEREYRRLARRRREAARAWDRSTAYMCALRGAQYDHDRQVALKTAYDAVSAEVGAWYRARSDGTEQAAIAAWLANWQAKWDAEQAAKHAAKSRPTPSP